MSNSPLTISFGETEAERRGVAQDFKKVRNLASSVEIDARTFHELSARMQDLLQRAARL